ncbi:CoA transferase [Cereibacter sphaeroides]|uniref:CaiB/BaiF CoA transferase family protein n=1 Tax=Cereibacter sphaeroides TaxID=1063 RepID=UPI000F53382F|nr:CaiB/BaiF CoA-transferase family protein [Cereibacter sphaeroides]AZB57073.1 CoA transferase [Cereibacter sphaeroides]AZB61364.1 CoA transferase [Cereibacter sphaeroides]
MSLAEGGPEASGEAPAGPLAGLRIVEMVGLGPCPFAAMMLSDAGAEVIRVHPLAARAEIPLMDTEFDVLARGRRSIAIDLKRPEGVALLLDLAERADGLMEGFRPGVMERLGLGPAECHARNPRLVYGRMTGWGQDGPLAATAGHDLTYIALSGVLGALGPADRPPAVPLNLIGDFGGGGMMLAFGMVAALLQARATGRGQVVDAAMTEGASLLAAMIWGFRAGGAWQDGRQANLLDGGAWFYGTYECADGRFLAVAPIEGRFARTLLERLGPEAAELRQGPPADWPAQRTRLAGILRTKPRDEWVALFAGTDACVAPVLDWSEAPEHPQARARESFVTVGGVPQPAPAPRFSGSPGPRPSSPARPGADTAEILARWGVDGGPAAAAGAIPTG